jgi:capsular polysaccharide biosynthesis protein
MDLNDAWQRVVLRHLALIGVCVAVPVLIVVAMSFGGSHTYSSSARVAVGTQAARSTQEAVAQAAQVEAIATSRTVVAAALRVAGVSRPAARTASQQVSVTGLGSSPVTRLTVRDRDAGVARRITQALANQVVAVLAGPRDELRRGRAQVEDRITSLQLRRDDVLSAAPALMSAKDSAAIAGVDDELRALGDQLVGIDAQLATTTDPQVVDDAGPPSAVPSSRLPDATLAGLLGLVVGLGIAAGRESLHPTVVGVEALSKIFSAPPLGTVDQRDGVRMGMSLDRLATRVDIAARRVGVNVVALSGPLPEAKLADLAQDLDYLTAGHALPRVGDVPVSRLQTQLQARLQVRNQNGARAAAAVATEARPLGTTDLNDPTVTWETVRVLPCDERTLSLLGRSGGQRMGMLVVAGRSTPRDNLLHIEDVVGTTGWPLIGVISVAREPRTSRVMDTVRRTARELFS